jgi:GntR family transcriptional regulator/MocR family aminotransferase
VALELPATADDRALRDAARQRGVLVHCFSQYTIRRPARPGLVIGYGRLHEDAIAPAVGALASVLTDAPIEPAPAASFLTRKDRSA